MEEAYKKILDSSVLKKRQIRDYLRKVSHKPPKNLDNEAADATVEVFKKIHCLKCANCCSTTSPIFRTVDIDRICKHLRVKPGDFIEKNLHIDQDGDYVLNSSPCLFLNEDKYCRIYEFRPQACREYPHTDRKKFHLITELTLENTQICPAAAKVVEKLMNSVG